MSGLLTVKNGSRVVRVMLNFTLSWPSQNPTRRRIIGCHYS